MLLSVLDDEPDGGFTQLLPSNIRDWVIFPSLSSDELVDMLKLH